MRLPETCALIGVGFEESTGLIVVSPGFYFGHEHPHIFPAQLPNRGSARITWKWKMPAYSSPKPWSVGTTLAITYSFSVSEAMAANNQQSPGRTGRLFVSTQQHRFNAGRVITRRVRSLWSERDRAVGSFTASQEFVPVNLQHRQPDFVCLCGCALTCTSTDRNRK